MIFLMCKKQSVLGVRLSSLAAIQNANGIFLPSGGKR